MLDAPSNLFHLSAFTDVGLPIKSAPIVLTVFVIITANISQVINIAKPHFE